MYLQKLENFSLGAIIEDEYVHLVQRGVGSKDEYQVPFLPQLREEVSWTSCWNSRESEVHAAVMRKEYEIYSMDKKEFVREAMAGRLRGFELKTISALEIQDQIVGFLRTRFMVFIDYEENIINSPIGRGIW